MARFTREQLQDQIAAAVTRDVIYKIEVDEFKYSVSRTFESERNKIMDMMRGTNVEADSASDVKLYYGMPYLLAHMYGKKFEKLLSESADTPYKAAVVELQKRWVQIAENMVILHQRQKAGRRPVEKTRKVVGTRIQKRGICSCCFRQQAVTRNNIAEHGFHLQFESRNGSCYGSGKPHFGLEAGLSFTKALAAELRKRAKHRYEKAEAILNKDVPLTDRKTLKQIENPTQRQIDREVQLLRAEAGDCDYSAKAYEKRIATWIPEDPVDVEVEVYE